MEFQFDILVLWLRPCCGGVEPGPLGWGDGARSSRVGGLFIKAATLPLIFLLLPPQVFRSKLDSDSGPSPHQSRSGSTSPLQQGAATLGRHSKVGGSSDGLAAGPPAPMGTDLCFLALQSPLLATGSTGSLPRNLAATLQDIEAKRQLALQQKGDAGTPTQGQGRPVWVLSEGEKVKLG